MSEVRPIDKQARKNLADESKDLMNNPAFLKAIIALRKNWFDETMAMKPGPERDEVFAKVKALDELPLKLTSFMNDEIVARKRGA